VELVFTVGSSTARWRQARCATAACTPHRGPHEENPGCGLTARLEPRL
jgi:hypothetical protein